MHTVNYLKVFDLGNLFMILTGFKLRKNKLGNINWIVEYQAKCWKENEKTLKIARKLPKSPYFFHFLEKYLS